MRKIKASEMKRDLSWLVIQNDRVIAAFMHSRDANDFANAVEAYDANLPAIVEISA